MKSYFSSILYRGKRNILYLLQDSNFGVLEVQMEKINKIWKEEDIKNNTDKNENKPIDILFILLTIGRFGKLF